MTAGPSGTARQAVAGEIRIAAPIGANGKGATSAILSHV